MTASPQVPPALPPQRKPPKAPALSLRGLRHNRRGQALLWQILVIGTVVALGLWLFSNAQAALARQGMRTGYAFLGMPAGFDIGDTLIAFNSSDSFLRAYGVALLNTMKISIAAILCASLLGLFFGIGRLSRNLLFRKISTVYVEFFRNTPQLVQLIFWYTIITGLPRPRDAWSLGELAFLSNRGLLLPWPAAMTDVLVLLMTLVLGGIAAAQIRRRVSGRLSGILATLAFVTPAAAASVFGVHWSLPELRGFNFVGGLALTPEFLALLLGLSLYIGAFLAEIVRAGVLSVGRGQVEAARSVGLLPWQISRRVVLPQALRVMVPPATTQYVSVIKNSSLGVAIGYPELFNVNNTIATLSGHAVEAMFIMMTIYLAISGLIALLMNLTNHHVQIRER